MRELLRVYYDPDEIAPAGHKYAGYPWAWFEETHGPRLNPPIKDLIREQAGHRCVRCGHPFVVGETPGEWSPCDHHCAHGGPILADGHPGVVSDQSVTVAQLMAKRVVVKAQWRVLTVHHLNGIKADCRWFNLSALCQRCHLTIQGKVYMERPWFREHSSWFKPYVAAFYAWHYFELELSREETMERLEELLALEHRQLELGGS